MSADGRMHVYHEFARLRSMTQWWHWLLLLAVCAALVTYVALLYRRDGRELAPGLRGALLSLRLAALGGILFFFLDLERRCERQLVKNSQAFVLVDTSLSMGIQDVTGEPPSGARRRIDGVIEELAKGTMVGRLRQDHDVEIYRFDENEAPVQVASYPKIQSRRQEEQARRDRSAAIAAELAAARRTAAAAGVLLLAAAAAFAMFLVWAIRRGGAGSWALLAGTWSLLAAVVLLAAANLRSPDIPFLALLGLGKPAPWPTAGDQRAEEPAAADARFAAFVDWSQQLAPRGSETRLGDALRWLIDQERGEPMAGILVFTDGGNNAGKDCSEAVAAAADASVPLLPVGLGSERRPAHVRVADVEAPLRVYPGDAFSLTGYLQAFGLAGRAVKVELRSSSPPAQQGKAEQGKDPGEQLEEDRRVTLGPDGEILPVKFSVTPARTGRRAYRLQVSPPEEDHDPRDDARTVHVDVVERKSRVLLFAGGPTREFIFLRNLLFRDRDTTVDVYLQTGRPGMSQEADQLLFEFPKVAAQLFEYDAIAALDPDWRALGEQEVRLLERWVAEEAGGLIVVAGPVHTPQWSTRGYGDQPLETIKALYPVVFFGRGSATLSTGRFASETPWPLQFSRDGQDAEFLRVEDDPLANERAWASFEGVYGYYAVKDPKAGARVYARFSDPNTAIDGQLPIYLAAHFYGAGRVFFQASGEMWRIRSVNEAYFDRYYTKLIRWVAQGRLLRDSRRGLLLLDKDRCVLGDRVAVRAILTDAQFLPLRAEEVSATLVHPDGSRSALALRRSKEAAREGMYAGEFTAVLEGDYRVEVQPPQAAEGEMLTKEVRSRIPARETERPERNDALLREMAERTGGAYYVGMDAALNRGAAGRAPVFNVLAPQDQVTLLPGTPDTAFERLLMTWLMAFICGALCLEWLIRRLAKLA